MDNKKDIISYKTDKKAIAEKGGDLKGSEATGEQESTKNEIQKESASFSVFLNKKTEKLAMATYMVTSFLSDKEPLKWKLREKSTDLLSGILDVRNNNTSEVENIFADYSFAVDEIISLLEVASAAKLISEMNYTILKKEYALLKQLIDSDEYAEKKMGRFVFSKNFFPQRETLELSTNIKDIEKDINSRDSHNAENKNEGGGGKGQIKLNAHNATADISQRQKRTFPEITPVKKIYIKTKKPTMLKDIKVSKTNRRDAVLRLFKKNKELTIKDISREVSGCSEKTIQRELNTLISEGVLNKIGERRWSRYSLK